MGSSDRLARKLEDLRIATVVIIVMVQEGYGHSLVPGLHNGHVQLRDHSVGNLIPPTALQYDLRAIGHRQKSFSAREPLSMPASVQFNKPPARSSPLTVHDPR